jgi:hypothetical protein
VRDFNNAAALECGIPRNLETSEMVIALCSLANNSKMARVRSQDLTGDGAGEQLNRVWMLAMFGTPKREVE